MKNEVWTYKLQFSYSRSKGFLSKCSPFTDKLLILIDSKSFINTYLISSLIMNFEKMKQYHISYEYQSQRIKKLKTIRGYDRQIHLDKERKIE